MDNETLEQSTPLETTGNIVSMTESNNDLTIGQMLRQARENKNLSIDAISRHTKINVTNLMALESNDIESLPNIAYVKGFVKSYAKIVGLDTQHALSVLDQLYHIPSENQEEIEIETTQETEELASAQRVTSPEAIATGSASSKTMPNDLKIKIFGAVAACAIAAFVFINKDPKQSDSDKEQIVVKPQLLTAQTPLTQTKKEEIKADEVKEVSEVEVAVKEQELKTTEPVKEETKKEVAKQEAIPAKEEIKKEENKEKKEKEEKIDFYSMPSPLFQINEMSTEKVKELIPSNYYNAVEVGRQNVLIHATSGDTWLTFKIDEEPVKKYILKKDRYAMFKGEDVRVLLGNVHVTKVYLNNQMLDIKSRSGVKSLVFPIEKSKELKLPLFIFKKDGSVITSQKYLEENPQE